MRITGSERQYDPAPMDELTEVLVDIAGLGEAYAMCDMIEALFASPDKFGSYDDGENVIIIVKAEG